MLRAVFVLGVVAFIFCACAANGFCEEKKAAETNGMDLLSELLKAKGVITPEEADALKAKITGAESTESIKALVNLLKNKGLVSEGEAERFNQTLAKKPTPAQAAAKAILVVPRDQEYVQKITENVKTEVKKDIHDQVQTEVAEKASQGALQSYLAPNLPDWLQRLQFSGDMRLRIQPYYFPKSNATFVEDPNNPTQSLNTNVNRMNEYLRLRLKVEADVNDQMTLGVRLATGDQTNPVSDNVIFGNYFAKNGFVLDQAYLRYHPFADLNIWAGRMPNPWFYTDLIWANDLNFEGVAAAYKRNIVGDLTGYLTGGAFPLQDLYQESPMLSSHDKWLFGGQGVMEFKRDKEYSVKLGVALYDYESITGIENPPYLSNYNYT
ncbi:MAG TPA: putative porin, partial [Syntrophobacteraceae bacterium]|nr:putative porin [Syntrophobacteraceae bacterium]